MFTKKKKKVNSKYKFETKTEVSVSELRYLDLFAKQDMNVLGGVLI